MDAERSVFDQLRLPVSSETPIMINIPSSRKNKGELVPLPAAYHTPSFNGMCEQGADYQSSRALVRTTVNHVLAVRCAAACRVPSGEENTFYGIRHRGNSFCAPLNSERKYFLKCNSHCSQ